MNKKPPQRPKVELCGMRGGIEEVYEYADPAIDFVNPPAAFVRCERCVTTVECDLLGLCAWSERITIDGPVR